MTNHIDINSKFENINHYELLTVNEEIELGNIINNSHVDSKEYKAAFDKLILCNIRLLVKLANDLSKKTGVDAEDLMSEGYKGLISAIEKYNPSQHGDSRFATYATHWINKNMRIYVNKNMIAHVPTWISCEVVKYRKLVNSSYKELTHNEIKEKLNLNDREMYLLSQANVKSVSLSTPVETETDNKAVTFEETLPEEKILNPDTQALLNERNNLIYDAIQTLTPMEKDIIQSQYLNDEKIILQDIAVKYNLSSERIRQIRIATVNKLHDLLRKDGLQYSY